MKILNTAFFVLSLFSIPLAAEARSGGIDTWSESRCREYLVDKAEAKYDRRADADANAFFPDRERLLDYREDMRETVRLARTMESPCGEVKELYSEHVELDLKREEEREAAEEAFRQREEMDYQKSLVSVPISY